MVSNTMAFPAAIWARPRASWKVGLLIALSAGPSPLFAQTERRPQSDLLTPEDMALLLGARFGVDPSGVIVRPEVREHVRLQSRQASLPAHDPPLHVWLGAETGQIITVVHNWPGTIGGRVDLPEGAPRTPVLDQAAAERVALAAVRDCVGVLPDTYELADAGFHDTYASICYRFRWQEVVRGVRLPHRITVYVDASTGRVATLWRLVYPVTVPLEPKVTSEEAIGTALDRCRPSLQPGETLATPKAVLQADFGHNAKYVYPNDRQFLMWSIEVWTAGATPRPVQWVEVDAITGGVIGDLVPAGESGLQGAPASASQADSAAPLDRRQRAGLGVWTGSVLLGLVLAAGLLLLSRRRATAVSPPCP
jgi:hypothetical protein